MKTLLILILLASAFCFFGMPYYYAYKRRQKLMEGDRKSDSDKMGSLSTGNGNEI